MLFAGLGVCLCVSCFPGGIVEKGGFTDHIDLQPEATLTKEADYQIVCKDEDEIARRIELEKSGEPVPNTPAVIYKDKGGYTGGCEVDTETSQFFLFHLWPMTPFLDPTYALGIAVQELEGDTMTQIRIWHETHYYSILGHVRVMHLRGNVVRFLQPKATKVQ